MSSYKKKPLRLQEILEEIENCIGDNSSGEDDDEMIESENLITVYIQPPADGNETEEDSGDEDHVKIRNLPGSQLLSEGKYRTNESPSTQDVTPHVGVEKENPPQPTTSKSILKKSGKSERKSLKIRQWHVDDIPCMEKHTSYPYRPSAADLPRHPHEIFELFLDTLPIERLTKDTVMYAVQHGNHTFQLTCNEMKVFISILLLSGYNTLPRRRLCWSMELDVRNELIASSMRRNRFDEIMKHLHAADNTDLDKEDKFAKVRSILDILNERFLKYGEVFGPTSISIDESMVPY
ncbi:piggyBac transposable element-derived protein 3-like [Portunus trituberculatus]|uniref:piggyBac transposable element-derived protein 3-like n=1 Tax=Portunus trituberculatus TaxID=210409 RepID=UPI001E1CB629|nr:piggyBac transposable element-derived protein 3-like [Portunus trituberculatus]